MRTERSMRSPASEVLEELHWIGGHLVQAAGAACKVAARRWIRAWRDGSPGSFRRNERLVERVLAGDWAGAKAAARAGADPHEILEVWGQEKWSWGWRDGEGERGADLVKAALDLGADPNRPIQSLGGRSLVGEALYSCQWEAARAGLAFGGEDDGLDPEELFGMLSGVRLRKEGLALWQELGFEVDWRSREGGGFLLRAAECGDLAGIDLLLASGADPNLGDRWGRRPLGAAARICERGRGDCAGRRAAAMLLAAGADPWAGAEETSGFCALAYAVAADSDGMVEDLLAAMDPAEAPGGSRRRGEVLRCLEEARMRQEFRFHRGPAASRIEAWLSVAEELEAVEEACGPCRGGKTGPLRV